MKSSWLVPGALAAACILYGAAGAQTAAPPPAPKAQTAADTQTFEDWTVRCVTGATPPCQMIQLAQNKAGKRVSSLIIVYLPHQNSYALQLVTPLGVGFAQGATISAGSWTSKALPFRRCDATGCFVSNAIDSITLDTLARGPDKGKITLTTAATGKPIALPLSLRGFAAARSAMETETRAKESAAPTKPAAAVKPAPARR
jgi:invasion protein IalB